MKEDILQMSWLMQYFSKQDLKTTSGVPITVLYPGSHNKDAGPDFTQARLKIGNIEWVGNVEVHVSSSDWYRHNHQSDPVYDNLILHVVWKYDAEVKRKSGEEIPTLELHNRIDRSLLEKISLLDNKNIIPCFGFNQQVSGVSYYSALERAAVERLSRKSIEVLKLLKDNNYDWEETFYQTLGKNFGFELNGDPFRRLTKGLPYKTILKYRDSPFQVEALLFGMAGLLEPEFEEEYPRKLKKEFDFLSKKHDLIPSVKPEDWKLLRLRPANFPAIRIAQFAAFLVKSENVFSKLIELESIGEIRSLFKGEMNTYWKNHYLFGRVSKERSTEIGDTALNIVLINSVCPLLFALSKYRSNEGFMQKALDFLEKIDPEKNVITDRLKKSGFEFSSAFDTQGGIELYKMYCAKKMSGLCSRL